MLRLEAGPTVLGYTRVVGRVLEYPRVRDSGR